MSTHWCIRHLTNKEYCQEFDVSVAFDKRLDECHPSVLPSCPPLFTNVPVKLLPNGLILYGLCQVNFMGQGVELLSLIVNVRTSENDPSRSIPT